MVKIKYKMGFDVKNTTFFGLLDLICPYSCKGCGRLGTPFCGCCKKYYCCRKNLELVRRKLGEEGAGGGGETFWGGGGREAFRGESGRPGGKVFEGVFGYSVREGVLAELIREYKYRPARGLSEIMAEFLDEAIPRSGVFGERLGGEGAESLEEAKGLEVVVVPLPTIRKHIRERGFDHAGLMARKLARRRGWKVERVLRRANETVQVGATEEERFRQAEEAYEVVRKFERRGARGGDEKVGDGKVGDGRTGVDENKVYLLVDDVWTTGASMRAAARVLREAGAERVYGAVVAVSGKM